MQHAFFWPSIGLVTITLVLVLFARGAWRGQGGKLGLLVGLACALVAIGNAIAPFRSVLDPDYIGYSFGLVELTKGWPVSMFATLLYASGIASMVIALRGRRGPAMALVAVFCAAMAVTLGGALLKVGMTDPAQFTVQLGEYATIPAEAAIPLVFALVVLPFLIGVPWALRRLR